MIYLLWSLLNIGLLVFFIVLCFQATKLIRSNFGLFAAIIFVLGLLSFSGSSSSRNDANGKKINQLKKWTFTDRNDVRLNTAKFQSVRIDSSLTTAIDLAVLYGTDKTTAKPVAIEATSPMTGFVSGYAWKPLVVSVDTTSTSGHLTYHVEGVREWNLLGTMVYSQFRTYSGVFTTK